MRDLSEKYFPIIRKLLSSGLTMESFSKQEGINIKTLHYWKRKYRNLHLPAGRIKIKKGEVRQTGFANLTFTGIEQPGEINIHYADGTRLGFSGSYDAALIKQFIPTFDK